MVYYDGRDLSFQGMKSIGLRYHYASCLYDSVTLLLSQYPRMNIPCNFFFLPQNIYLAKYPPGEANQDSQGQVKDVMGDEMK